MYRFFCGIFRVVYTLSYALTSFASTCDEYSSRASMVLHAYEFRVRASMTRLRQRALARLRCTRMSFDGEHACGFPHEHCARIRYRHDQVIAAKAVMTHVAHLSEHRSRDFVRDACVMHSSEHAPRFRSRSTIRVMRANGVIVTFLRDFVKASRSCTHAVPRARGARVRAPVSLTHFSYRIKCLP